MAGLEPVTSAVTGQRSNQLSYTPAKGRQILLKAARAVKANKKGRPADAKEVGVGNPAEENVLPPELIKNKPSRRFVNRLKTPGASKS